MMRLRDRLRRWIPEMVLLGMFVIVGGLIDSRLVDHLDIDSHRYLELGERFLQSGRFIMEDIRGELTTDYSRTPVLPMLIAAGIGIAGSKAGGIVAVIWLQRLAWGVVMLFFYPAIKRADGRWRRKILFAKIALLFSPVIVYHGALLLTDLLYATLLFLTVKISVNVLFRNQKTAAMNAGILHGFEVLLRPVHAPIPVLIAIPWLRRRLACSVVLIAVSGLFTFGWMARNFAGNGAWSLTNIGGRTLALHRENAIREMEPTESGVKLGSEFITSLKSTEESAYTAAWIMMRDYDMTDTQADKVAGLVAQESIVQRPFAYGADVAKNFWRLIISKQEGVKLAALCGVAEDGAMARVAGWAGALWTFVVFLVTPAWLMIRVVEKRLVRNRCTASALLTTAFVMAVPCLTTVTYGRFLLPALPLLGFVYCLADAGSGGKKSVWYKQGKTAN